MRTPITYSCFLLFSIIMLSFSGVFSQSTNLVKDSVWSGDDELKPLSHYISHHKDGNPISLTAPANDGICGAIALSNTECYPRVVANWTTFNNSTATWEASPGTPPCWGFFYGATVWYKFTATSTAQLITTDWYYGSGGNIDNQIAVYSSSNNLCSGTLTRIGCNEDIAWSGSLYGNNILYNPDYFSDVTVTGLTIGNTYFIRVDGQYDACGFGCWTPGWSAICTQVAPSNDACATAQAVSINTVYNSSNNGAGPVSNNEVPDKAFTCGSTENMIYFTFTAPATDVFYINQWSQTCSYNRGTQFIIYKSAYNCTSIPAATGSASSTYELYCSAQSTSDRNFSINLTAGQTYYIAIDGGAGDECAFSWEITQSNPLPVELIAFHCSSTENSIKLRWQTVFESNSHYFTVERSEDGKTFLEIARITAAGHSNVIKSYEFTDTEPRVGYNYYRLSNIDFNGDNHTYETIECDHIISDVEVTVELIDATGRIVDKMKTTFNDRKEILENEQISEGVYILNIRGKNGILTTEKCVKLHKGY